LARIFVGSALTRRVALPQDRVGILAALAHMQHTVTRKKNRIMETYIQGDPAMMVFERVVSQPSRIERW
jgi:hypothetical protein